MRTTQLGNLDLQGTTKMKNTMVLPGSCLGLLSATRLRKDHQRILKVNLLPILTPQVPDNQHQPLRQHLMMIHISGCCDKRCVIEMGLWNPTDLRRTHMRCPDLQEQSVRNLKLQTWVLKLTTG